jgi:hypothetical protein
MTAATPAPTTAPPGTPPVGRIKTRFKPSPAVWLSVLLLTIAIGATVIFSGGDGFAPRVPTLDALAGLVIAAFAVDRLLTFIPPFLARGTGRSRARHRLAALGLGRRTRRRVRMADRTRGHRGPDRHE